VAIIPGKGLHPRARLGNERHFIENRLAIMSSKAGQEATTNGQSDPAEPGKGRMAAAAGAPSLRVQVAGNVGRARKRSATKGRRLVSGAGRWGFLVHRA
jgi:hypothetical protein